MQILFTDRVLPTIRRMDQILGGTSITIALSRPTIMVAYAFISSRFRPSLTGLDTEFAGRSSVLVFILRTVTQRCC